MSKYTHNVNNFSIEKDKRFTYANTRGWQKDAFLEVMNGLNDKNKRLKEQIKELKKEKEFWKHNCISESNRNSILISELGFAQEQGYKWSNAFEEYENSIKENNEWNKKYISEKESGDDVK